MVGRWRSSRASQLLNWAIGIRWWTLIQWTVNMREIIHVKRRMKQHLSITHPIYALTVPAQQLVTNSRNRVFYDFIYFNTNFKWQSNPLHYRHPLVRINNICTYSTVFFLGVSHSTTQNCPFRFWQWTFEFRWLGEHCVLSDLWRFAHWVQMALEWTASERSSRYHNSQIRQSQFGAEYRFSEWKTCWQLHMSSMEQCCSI